MKNAKKTLSLVMIAVFTTFIVLSGVPTSAATSAAAKAKVAAAAKAKTAAAKKQVTVATTAVVRGETYVKVKTFNTTTAQTIVTKAKAEVTKIKAYGSAYTATYTKLVARDNAVQTKVNAKKVADAKAVAVAKQKAADTAKAKALLATATTAVANAEAKTNTDTYDLVGNADDLAAAQEAVTAALEAVVNTGLDKDSSDYLGLMARIDAANAVIEKANEDIQSAADAKTTADAEAAAEVAAEKAVAAVEAAPLVTADDLTAIAALDKTAQDAVAAVTDTTKAADFSARLKVVADKEASVKSDLDAAAAKSAADAAEAARPADLVSVSAVDGTLTVTFDKAPIDGQSVTPSDFVVSKTVTTDSAVTTTVVPTDVEVSNEAADGSMYTITVPAVTPALPAQSVVYNVAYGTGEAISAPAYNVAAMAPFGVASVKAVNLKQILVTFNRPVDSTSATTVGNYSFVSSAHTTALTAPTGSVADSAVLQADGKSVLLTLEQPNAALLDTNANGINNRLSQQVGYTFQVSNVRDTTNDIMATVSNLTFTAMDLNVPTVQSVKVISPSVLQVFFSAPLQADNGTYLASSDFTLDNGQYSVSPQTPNDSDCSVVLSLGSSLPAGSHTLTVNAAAKGYNGLIVNASTQTFTVGVDTSAPTVSVSSITVNSATQTAVVFKFSKPVALNSAHFYYNFNNLNSAYNGTVATVDSSATTFNQGGTTYADMYDVNFATALPAGNTTFFVENDKDITTASTSVITDAWGNTFTSTSVVGTYTIDTTKPVVLSAVMNGQNEIDVTYSKTMDLSSPITGTNYVLKNAAGVAVTAGTVSGLAVNYAGNPLTIYAPNTTLNLNPYYAIKLGANLAPGNYSLTISGVTDSVQPVENTIATQTFTLVVTDSTAPTVSAVTASGNHIYVYYSKAMNTVGIASILDVSNYYWLGAGLPSGTTIAATNGNTVAVITLPTTSTATSGNSFQIGTVKDTNGNVLIGYSQALTADQVLPTDLYNDATYNSVKATGTNTITFEVKQPLENVNASYIKVNGLPAASATYVNTLVDNGTISGALVTVTANSTVAWSNDLTGLTASTPQVEIDTATVNGSVVGGLQNINGSYNSQILTLGTVTKAQDYIAPGFSSTVAPYTVTTGGTPNLLDHVVVTFNEPVLQASVNLGTFAIAGYNVVNVAPIGTPVQNTYNGITTTGYTQYAIYVQHNTVDDHLAQPGVTLLLAVKDNSAQQNILPAGTAILGTVLTATAPVVTLSSISVAGPTKTVYNVGDALDITGLVVTAHNSDASTAILANGSYTVSGYVPTTVGTQTITVTYQGKTATFNVTVNAASAVVTNATATFDGLLMTNIAATVPATVTKVDILKGANILVSAVPTANAISASVIGAAKGDTLTLNAYNGATLVGTANVTVQ